MRMFHKGGFLKPLSNDADDLKGDRIIPLADYAKAAEWLKADSSNQEAKADAGKPRLTLVPRQIIFDVARVREYAVDHKYKDPDNWKRVEVERYRDAAYRHFMAYLDDPHGVDEESGLSHLAHLATNIAFLCELERGDAD